MEWIRTLLRKHGDILTYLFFGVLTTAVNFLVYVPLYRWIHLSAALSNMLAWAAAVVFAFLTNKPFVFKSCDWSAAVVFPELGKFVGSRIVSGVLETGFLGLTVDLLQLNAFVMKIIAAIFVVILNYVASRWLVFKKK